MIIVTGGAGFIGSNIVKQLNNNGRNDILIVDDLFFCFHTDLAVAPSASVTTHAGGSSRIRFCGEAVRRTNGD